jgi:hypothetical protein
MARRKVEHPREKQILLRITAAELEVLEAAAYLEGMTPNAYAHRLVVRALGVATKDRHVSEGVEIRRAYRTARESPVTPIDRRGSSEQRS